jgi:penicillin-binding protein A
MGYYTNSSGKTGTSESFIDTDNDGKVDTETITTSFVGYSPSDNPKMSVVVVSPDISLPDNPQSLVTKRISANIVNKYFELNS